MEATHAGNAQINDNLHSFQHSAIVVDGCTEHIRPILSHPAGGGAKADGEDARIVQGCCGSKNFAINYGCHNCVLIVAADESSGNFNRLFRGALRIIHNQFYFIAVGADIETYVSSDRTLLLEANTLSEPQFWDSYSDISLQQDKINDNVRQVHFFYLRNVFRLSEHAIVLWNMQLRVSLIIVGVSLLLLIFISRFYQEHHNARYASCTQCKAEYQYSAFTNGEGHASRPEYDHQPSCRRYFPAAKAP